jgi:sugar-phosphatase
MPRTFRALLLDLDGTLVDSRAATEAGWRVWARSHGLGEQADEIARTCHGVPSAQHVAAWAPQLDAAAEAAAVEAAQEATSEPTPAFPGAAELLALLPPDRVAVVTSGRPQLARGRLDAAGLPVPAVLVTAEDVAAGKPDPAPYRLGAARLGVDPAECLVIEDAPPGVAAARAAGCGVVAVAHTHACAELAARCFACLGDALEVVAALVE